MSSQRGNCKKTGPPKHQNKTAFKNNMHDTSRRTQQLNSMEVSGVCARCKNIIDWKIRYKKYKPLTVPKKCTRCGQRSVKRAYCMVCTDCCKTLTVCAKCGQKGEPVIETGLSAAEEASHNSRLQQELKLLPERQRRTFVRHQTSGKLSNNAEDNVNSSESEGDENLSDSDNGEPVEGVTTIHSVEMETGTLEPTMAQLEVQSQECTDNNLQLG